MILALVLKSSIEPTTCAPDLHLDRTPTSNSEGDIKCKELGYDGLAVLSTPEVFVLAVNLTSPFRQGRTGGINVGMGRADSKNAQPRWYDGTDVTQDVPMKHQDNVTLTFGRMVLNGKISMTSGLSPRYSLCGNYRFRRTGGASHDGRKAADGAGDTYAAVRVRSFLECMALCGKDYRCRAAEFDKTGKICSIRGPGDYSQLDDDPGSKTFVRVAFEQW